MRFSSSLFVVRLATLPGLAVSALLLVDQLRPTPLLCVSEGSCATVLSSGFGHVLGLPLPLLGILGFAGVLLASLVPGRPAGRMRAALAWAGGGVGLGLVLIQVVVLGAVCPFCLIADLSALVIAFADPGAHRGLAPDERAQWRSWAWLGLAPAALVIPLSWGWVPAPEAPVPKAIAALRAPGKITVVEIADFECPFCRKMDPVLARLVREYGDRVHFVRLNVPLPSHPQARAAARAYRCAGEQGAEARMAEALFAADDLSPAAGLRLAGQMGLSVPAFQACLASPRTERAIDASLRLLEELELAGVPAVWIQDRLLLGAQTEEELRAAFHEAESSFR